LDNLLFTIICLFVGAFAGFLGGLLGIGGGIVIVPALILLFDHSDALAGASSGAASVTLIAVGTSLATIIFTSASAARVQIRAAMVDWTIVRRFTLLLVIGSYAAGFLAALLNGVTLRLLIGAFLAAVAVVMLTNWRPAPHRVLPGRFGCAVIAATAGLVSGIAGIGGGNVIVPTLIYYNVANHRATATATTLGFPIAVAGTLGYIHRGFHETSFADGLLGFVYLPALLAIVTTTILFAPLGVRVAHRLAPLPLRRAFGVLLMLVSARMCWAVLAP
jgi:uncharacterized membrane protein YfcA